MGMMGNKGGVAIRLSLFDSSLCVVCAHLAAHRENVVGRNSDYRNIVNRTVFCVDPYLDPIAGEETQAAGSGGSDVIRPKHGAEYSQTQELHILDHEIVFWLGDLNYRIDEGVPLEEVFRHVASNNLIHLRQFDQLNIERLKGNCFHGFSEGDLSFPPTYKYEPGSDRYDRRPDKKTRAPAWCDRVLWRAGERGAASSVRLLDYRSAGLLPSDHKPVSALFETAVRVVVAEKERLVFQELVNTLEFWKSPCKLPQVEVTGLQVDMCGVRYEVGGGTRYRLPLADPSTDRRRRSHRLRSFTSATWATLSSTGTS